LALNCLGEGYEKGDFVEKALFYFDRSCIDNVTSYKSNRFDMIPFLAIERIYQKHYSLDRFLEHLSFICGEEYTFSLYTMCYNYLHRIYVPKDNIVAFYYFKLSAELKCIKSFVELERLYKEGNVVENNFKNFLEFVKKVAGDDYADFLYEIGKAAQNGDLLFFFLTLAGELNHKKSLIDLEMFYRGYIQRFHNRAKADLIHKILELLN
jgi:TPR repeat protein